MKILVFHDVQVSIFIRLFVAQLSTLRKTNLLIIGPFAHKCESNFQGKYAITYSCFVDSIMYFLIMHLS